jgi:hypothetical protein
MQIRGDAQEPQSHAVGDKVRSGATTGTVVSVDAERQVMQVLWGDADYGPITYPLHAEWIERVFPWE